MARSLASKEYTEAPAGIYPHGRIKDKTSSTHGTKVNENVYGDFHQFFAHLLDQAGVTANGEPDNDYVGYQYFEAFMKCVWKAISLPSTTDELASGSTNLNDFVKPGIYSITSAYTNGPSGLGATAQLIVSGTVGSSIKQIIVDDTNGAEWIRTYTAPTTYSSWELIRHGELSQEIGVWNMYTGGGGSITKNVTHSIPSFAKVKSMTIMIRNDANDNVYVLNSDAARIDATTIYLTDTDSLHDFVGFSSTSISRGRIILKYDPT